MSNEEDRAALDIAVMTVLTNVMNFPEKVQARLLGQDMRPLGDRVIDAVLDAGFHRTPAPAPVDALCEHDAALIESLADEVDLPGSIATWDYSREQVAGYRDAERDIEAWLRERARQVREGEA